MFEDKMVNNFKSADAVTIHMPLDAEQFNPKRHWEVIDTIVSPDGNVESRRYFNTVVDDCSKVIASLMKGLDGYKGIAYWAVGSGDPSWSNSNPPVPSVSDVKLTNETFRKAIPAGSISFIDDSNNVTEKVTNRLQISLEFTESEANGELREFALFGGNASSAKDSGLMINHKIHPIIYKTSGMKLQRVIRITF